MLRFLFSQTFSPAVDEGFRAQEGHKRRTEKPAVDEVFRVQEVLNRRAWVQRRAAFFVFSNL